MPECYTGIINEFTANAAFNTGIDFMNTDHYCITLRVQRLFDFSFLFICLVLILSQSHIYLSNPYGIWDVYSLTAKNYFEFFAPSCDFDSSYCESVLFSILFIGKNSSHYE